MGPRRNVTRHGMGWIDRKSRGGLHVRRQGIAMREYEARHSIGQCCLADTLRASDQPRMRDSPSAIGTQQRPLGLVMSR